MKEIIREQKAVFEAEGSERLVEREALKKVSEFLKLPHVLVISGLRRSGKSTLLKQIRKNFYGNRPVYYFNFEDERLIGFVAEDFNLLYETFIELFGKSQVFFFDEIQNVEGWELFVRRMYERGFKFIITGSNSSLLSRELGTRLTGRYVGLELYPFSFPEFLKFKGVIFPEEPLTEERGLIKNAFNEYLEKGGIPEYLLFENAELLKTFYDNILYKDILVRYGLGDEKALRELALYLFSNYATEINYSKLQKLLGLGSANTVKNYIGYLENSYMVFTIPKYDYSLKKQIYAPKKVYAIDSAFINLISFKFSRDRGKMLENLVFLELKRRNLELYYHRARQECDFIVTENERPVGAIQVTMVLNGNREREYGGLLEALEAYDLDRGLILTEGEEFEEIVKDKKIIVRPIWKWLLE
ncbi:ATP-binding protein [Methanosarcina siciliae]|uniref:ATP-binding protein n=1 Tax=Methanosarcina siciliae TaxID=38027 RepID=UPI0018CE6876|nr:ATP-binding protein [Methanosarcina siciliae]